MKVLNLNESLPQLLELAKEPEYRALHRDTMVSWSNEKHVADLEEAGQYLGPMSGWQLTSSDYWFTRIDEAVGEAADGGDALAQDINALTFMACDLSEMNHEDLAGSLFDRADELKQPYEPKDAEALLPKHSCHDTVGLAYVTAVRLFPETTWEIATNAFHSWVQSEDGELVIDYLLFKEPPLEWYERSDTETFCDLEEYGIHLINYTEEAA